MKYTIWLNGCDDSTPVVMEMTAEEYEFMKKVQEESKRIGGGCKPTLEIVEGSYEE